MINGRHETDRRVAIHMAITAVVCGMEVTASVDWTHRTESEINYNSWTILDFEQKCDLNRVVWYGPAGGPVDSDTLAGYLLDGTDIVVVWSLVASEFNFDLDWWEEACPF